MYKDAKAGSRLTQMFAPIQNQSCVQAYDSTFSDTITRVDSDVFVALCSHHLLVSFVDRIC